MDARGAAQPVGKNLRPTPLGTRITDSVWRPHHGSAGGSSTHMAGIGTRPLRTSDTDGTHRSKSPANWRPRPPLLSVSAADTRHLARDRQRVGHRPGEAVSAPPLATGPVNGTSVAACSASTAGLSRGAPVPSAGDPLGSPPACEALMREEPSLLARFRSVRCPSPIARRSRTQRPPPACG
jgi:hypothetical protein